VWDCGCNIGQLGGVFKVPTKMGDIFGAVLVKFGEVIVLPNQIVIFGRILVNQVGGI